MLGQRFGFFFGMAGVGAAALGWLADRAGIVTVYEVCSFPPILALLCAFLPDVERARRA